MIGLADSYLPPPNTNKYQTYLKEIGGKLAIKLHQELPNCAGGCPQRDEYEREPEDERQRRDDDAPPYARQCNCHGALSCRAASHLVQGESRDVRQISRDQGKHTRRDEGQKSRSKRREQCDVFFHVIEPAAGGLQASGRSLDLF
jgi:hypothetical protein